jgi:hypothetical protein
MQTGYGSHPTSRTVGPEGPFPGVKSGRNVMLTTHPPSSAEVNKEQELYLLLPKCASMERNGPTLPFTIHRMAKSQLNS